MKRNIEYFYNIEIDNLDNNDYIYHFLYNGINHYFVPINRDDIEINDILSISMELKNKNIFVHDLVYNRNNTVITKLENISYVLIKPYYKIDDIVDITDIYNYANKISLNAEKSKIYRNNWEKLWSSKIDYFENQINELGIDKKIIVDSFSYYIGLSENAICYVNTVNRKYKNNLLSKITLQHRRLFYPNYTLNYFNPLSFIFDLQVRDIAEYLKSLFFKSDDALLELEIYLKIAKLSPYECSMLYGRLLYPSYYFDLYESIMNKEVDEEVLLPIINKVNEYELFLKQSYILISKYASIDKIEWIMNKKES